MRTPSIAAVLWLTCASAFAQVPGQEGFQTKAQQRQEFINKLRRDIARLKTEQSVRRAKAAAAAG